MVIGYSVTFSHHKQNQNKRRKTWKTGRRRTDKNLFRKLLSTRQKWQPQWRLISKTAWKVIRIFKQETFFRNLFLLTFQLRIWVLCLFKRVSTLPGEQKSRPGKGHFISNTTFYLHSPIPSYNEFAPSRVLVSPLEKVCFGIYILWP